MRRVIVPDKPTLRWFEPDGSTDEGDLQYKYDRSGSVSFEALYESICYSNAVFRRENDSAGPASNDGGSLFSRLHQFTITEEQHTHFRELLNVSSAERLLADTCGYRCGDDGDSDGSSTPESEESEEECESDSDNSAPVTVTRSRRQVKPSVRHLPMRSATHVLKKKRKLEEASVR
jgi:hypothetical protein